MQDRIPWALEMSLTSSLIAIRRRAADRKNSEMLLLEVPPEIERNGPHSAVQYW